MSTLFMVHLVATWFMVGVIWMVQVVHYPLMAHIGPGHSVAYQRMHVERMGILVVPIMLAEIAAAILLCLFLPFEAQSWPAWAGLGMLLVIWLVTALFSVPSHDVLVKRFDSQVHRRLVVSNIARVVLWTGRGILATTMLAV